MRLALIVNWIDVDARPSLELFGAQRWSRPLADKSTKLP